MKVTEGGMDTATTPKIAHDPSKIQRTDTGDN